MSNATDNPSIQVLKAGGSGVFTNYIYKAIPLAFDESMSYYETLAGLRDYLEETVIPTVNNNADAVAELQSLYEELNAYVDNYFNNLDVQEEINNKLDDMVADGTLQEIITAYIQSNVTWTFDTVADMKLSQNLIKGSFVRTLGFNEINDGGGAIYKISNTGTANEMNIIAIGSSLFANLIYGDKINLKQLGIIENTDITSAFQLACDLTNNIIVSDGNYNINKIIINKDINIEFINTNLTKTTVESSNESGCLEIRGNVKNTTTLSGNANELSNIISVTDDSNINVGDTIMIFTDASTETEEYYKQMMTTVKSINAGSITINDSLNWDYDSGTKVSVINTVKANIKGINFNYNNNGLTGRGHFIYLRYNKNSHISGITIKNTSCGILNILNSIDCLIEQCTGYNPVSIDPPFGEFINIKFSTNITAQNIKTTNYRRVVDYVGSCYCNTYNSYAEDGGFTTHGCLARYCSFNNCTTVNIKGNQIYNTIGNLIYFYDKDISFNNCEIINSSRGIYLVSNNTTAYINNCNFTNVTYPIMHKGIQRLEVKGCNFRNCERILINESDNINGYFTITDCYSISNTTQHQLIQGFLTNPVDVSNCLFEGSEIITSSTPIALYNSVIKSTPTNAIICVEGSIIYNCIFTKDIKINSNCTINSCKFRNVSVPDTTITGTNIQGNLYTGTINLADGSGNTVNNNIKIA